LAKKPKAEGSKMSKATRIKDFKNVVSFRAYYFLCEYLLESLHLTNLTPENKTQAIKTVENMSLNVVFDINSKDLTKYKTFGSKTQNELREAAISFGYFFQEDRPLRKSEIEIRLAKENAEKEIKILELKTEIDRLRSLK
jgi:hypothetical protein